MGDKNTDINKIINPNKENIVAAYEVSDVSQARDRAERIRTALNVSWQLVKDAYIARDWVALGYSTWDEYCTGEFGEFRIKLPREERQEVVSSMREIGMSTRAIASATGSSDMTVRRDLAAATNVAPESVPAPVTGTDGKTYAPKPRHEPATPEWEDVGTIHPSRLKDIARPTATTIPQSELDELNALPTEQPTMEQPQPRRTPITETAMAAVFELGKVIKKLESLIEDDRFEKHKTQIRESHLSDLGRAQTSLNNIIQNISQ